LTYHVGIYYFLQKNYRIALKKPITKLYYQFDESARMRWLPVIALPELFWNKP